MSLQSVRSLLLLVSFLMSTPLTGLAQEAEWEGLPPPDLLPMKKQVFHYRMDGKVRILFFWVGKEGVGGGQVVWTSSEPDVSGGWVDGVEVLFGSDPERVPGRHNRWGYARELAYWQRPDAESDAVLQRTFFEGFMSQSTEESLESVRRKSDSGSKGEGVLFEGLTSLVLPERTQARKKRFLAEGEANYRNPQSVAARFQESMPLDPPDEEKVLDYESGRNNLPIGFLTSVRYLSAGLIKNVADGRGFEETRRAPVSYVYNARSYVLRVKKAKLHRRFEFSAGRELSNVLEAGFELTRLDNGSDHEFEIWLPTQGEFAGIPLRIIDKPRWWLRVELNLSDSPTPEPAWSAPATGPSELMAVPASSRSTGQAAGSVRLWPSREGN